MIAASFPKSPAMKKETFLHIPEPCHENWDKMSPAQQGRFCQQCSKTVVDFSAMTDQQVLKVLSKESGSTCGRFTSDQLERPFVKESKPLLQSPYREDVVVNGLIRYRRTCRLGGMSTVITVSRTDTVKTMVQKFFKNEVFKIFPNPANSGSAVHLTIKNAGLYNIQLFDNNGKLYLVKELEVAADKLPILLPLPSSLAAGIYFIKATNRNTKKQFTDKLIIK